MKLSFFYFLVAGSLNCGTTDAFQNHYLSSLTTKTEISAVSEKSSSSKKKEFPANDYFENLLMKEENDDDDTSLLSPTAKYMATIEKKGEALDIDKFLGEMERYLGSVENKKSGTAVSPSSSSYSSISKMEQYLHNMNADDRSDAISDLGTATAIADIPIAADIPATTYTTMKASAGVDHRIIGSKMMPTATATTTAYPSPKIITPSSAVVSPSGYITTRIQPTTTSTSTTTTTEDNDIVAILHNKIITNKEIREKQKYPLTHVDTTFLGLSVAFIVAIPFFNDLLLQ